MGANVHVHVVYLYTHVHDVHVIILTNTLHNYDLMLIHAALFLSKWFDDNDNQRLINENQWSSGMNNTTAMINIHLFTGMKLNNMWTTCNTIVTLTMPQVDFKCQQQQHNYSTDWCDYISHWRGHMQSIHDIAQQVL